MLPLDSTMLLEHTDDDGTRYRFRYLTGRNQPQYLDLIDRWNATNKKIGKLHKELKSDEDISDEAFTKIQSELYSINNSMVDMFLVSINDTEYSKPSEEFLMDQPIGNSEQIVSIIFSLMPKLQGREAPELKNSLRPHTSPSNQTANSINAETATKKVKGDEDA